MSQQGDSPLEFVVRHVRVRKNVQHRLIEVIECRQREALLVSVAGGVQHDPLCYCNLVSRCGAKAWLHWLVSIRQAMKPLDSCLGVTTSLRGTYRYEDLFQFLPWGKVWLQGDVVKAGGTNATGASEPQPVVVHCASEQLCVVVPLLSVSKCATRNIHRCLMTPRKE